MRLNSIIINKITSAARDSFGDADVYLFGSRLDDAKKGGDIDIAVDTNLSGEEFRRRKAQFMAQLIRGNFELKVDLVNYNSKDELLSRQLKEHALLLREQTRSKES